MIESFYDQLAPYYKYVYQDWNASVERQANLLDGVIREFFGGQVHSILDAACGVGTQTLGLAQKGYSLTASDISAGEVEKARAEAVRRGLDIPFGVADMRHLQDVYPSKFDLVLACDNSVPHLLSDGEILQAFEQFHRVSTEQGGCLISVRDYESMERGGRKLVPRQVHETPEGKLLIFDLWEFDDEYYDITMYIVEDTGGAAKTHIVRGGRYYCVPISKLGQLMQAAGFSRVVTLRDRFYQPLLLGLKA